MRKFLFLCCVFSEMLYCQDQEVARKSLGFAEIPSIQVKVTIDGDEGIFYESSLRAKLFLLLQQKLPGLTIDASSQDRLELWVACHHVQPNAYGSAPFYFGSFDFMLERPARLSLTKKYYAEVDPIYWAVVWTHAGFFWGGKETIQSTFQKQLDEAVNILAYDFLTSQNELLKASK